MPKKSKSVKKSDENKAWNKRVKKSKPYNQDSILPKKVFYIYCEGENTEPEYFKAFPLTNASVKSYGYGETKTKLVKTLIAIKETENDEGIEYWAVFDMDKRPDNYAQQKEDFNNAIDLAKRNNVNVAYSDDAFELWFILHFRVVSESSYRHNHYKELSGYFDGNYEKKCKKKIFCKGIYNFLESHEKASQKEAIKRAKKLYNTVKDKSYANQNPVTTVYQLVEELNVYLPK